VSRLWFCKENTLQVPLAMHGLILKLSDSHSLKVACLHLSEKNMLLMIASWLKARRRKRSNKSLCPIVKAIIWRWSANYEINCGFFLPTLEDVIKTTRRIPDVTFPSLARRAAIMAARRAEAVIRRRLLRETNYQQHRHDGRINRRASVIKIHAASCFHLNIAQTHWRWQFFCRAIKLSKVACLKGTFLYIIISSLHTFN
jgi:hypothetical protein